MRATMLMMTMTLLMMTMMAKTTRMTNSMAIEMINATITMIAMTIMMLTTMAIRWASSLRRVTRKRPTPCCMLQTSRITRWRPPSRAKWLTRASP